MAVASNIALIRGVPIAVIVIRGTPSLDSATAKVAISLEIHRKVFSHVWWYKLRSNPL